VPQIRYDGKRRDGEYDVEWNKASHDNSDHSDNCSNVAEYESTPLATENRNPSATPQHDHEDHRQQLTGVPLRRRVIQPVTGLDNIQSGCDGETSRNDATEKANTNVNLAEQKRLRLRR